MKAEVFLILAQQLNLSLKTTTMKRLLVLIFPVLFLASCKTLVPFTNQLKQDNGWQQTELEAIQYYTSETIILNRHVKNDETSIVSGKIKTIDGRQVEEIIIKEGTPGIVTAFPDSERIAVSFEISDDYYLTFGIDQNRGGRYYLRLKDYKKNEYAKVTYIGQTYSLSPQSLNAFLEIDMKKIKKEQKSLRVAKGRTL